MFIALRTVCVGLFVLAVGGSAIGKTSSDSSTTPMYRYFELVSVREKSDRTHTIAIEGQNGKTWYREVQAVLDLRDIATESAWLDETPGDDTYSVRLVVRDKSQAKLRAWTLERVGQPIGVVVNGRLRYADTLHGPIQSTLLIPGLKTLDEALRVCATIHVAGDLDKVDERLQLVTLQYAKFSAGLQRLRDQHAREGPKPEAFEIVSLTKKPDDRHTQPIDGPDGESWYRDPEAGLNMSHLDAMSIGGMTNAAYGIKGVVKPSHMNPFLNWCRDRIGQYFGLISNGQLLHVDRIPGDLADKLNRFALVIEPVEPDQSVETTHPEINRGRPRVEVTVVEEYGRATVVSVDTDYLELVSIRENKDATHSVRVTAIDGGDWYREPTPGADLSHLVFGKAFVEYSAATKKPVIRIPIAGGHRKLVRAWSKSRVHQRIGFVLDGSLIWTGDLQNELTNTVSVPAFNTLDRALPVCAAIRVGGDDEAAGIELARMLGQP